MIKLEAIRPETFFRFRKKKRGGCGGRFHRFLKLFKRPLIRKFSSTICLKKKWPDCPESGYRWVEVTIQVFYCSKWEIPITAITLYLWT